MKNRSLLTIIAGCILVASCSKHSKIIITPKTPSTISYQDTLIHNGGSGAGVGAPFAAEYFPNSPGDEWTYQVTDSLHNNQQYEATIRVVNAGGSTKKWIVSLPDETDTFRVASHAGVLDFLPLPQTPHYDPPFFPTGMRIVLPFYRDLQWQYSPYPTQGKITGLDTLSQNNFGYPGKLQAFKLYLFLGGGTEYAGVLTVIFAPNVGIIRIDRYVLNTMPSAHEHWQLVSYKLTAPPVV